MNFALLREHAQTAGEFLDHVLFPRTQARQIDLRRGEFDSPVFGLMRLFEQLGYVQQRLRRNAAAIEADAAGVQLRIDQRDRHAEIGGKKCGGVSTGTAADHCNIQGLRFRHWEWMSFQASRFHGCKVVTTSAMSKSIGS